MLMEVDRTDARADAAANGSVPAATGRLPARRVARSVIAACAVLVLALVVGARVFADDPASASPDGAAGPADSPATVDNALPLALALDDTREDDDASVGDLAAPDRTPDRTPDAPVSLAVPGLPESVDLDEIEGHLVAHSTEGARSLRIHAGPDEQTPLVWELSVPDEFNQPRALLVRQQQGDWIEVDVPVRPNGSRGWILRADVDLRPVAHRLVVDLSDRSVIVWEGDEVVLDTTGAIGRPSDPTPTGSFFVRSIFPWDAQSVYGPWVIPLSAYSETIDQINGGDAVVAIHGTQRNDLLGSAASLGCIRLDNDVITELAALIDPGTPVEIVP